MSVTAASTQLNVKVTNVPNLSVGVTCVFEDLSESPGEVLPKGQVFCMSPSLRDVPTLTHGYGDKRVVKLSLKSKETGLKFITTDFVFYNCSVLQSEIVPNPDGTADGWFTEATLPLSVHWFGEELARMLCESLRWVEKQLLVPEARDSLIVSGFSVSTLF
ncbi:hypothetical protein SRHO_G00325130 [Serrasalmus rhombeus]